MNSIQIKRIYGPSAPDDGYRVLVDRLWPRGIKKTEAGLDSWPRNIAPSAELRKSFAHKTENFASFREAYRKELDENPEASAFARTCEALLVHRPVTLLYAAREGTCSNAAVLCEWLRQQIGENGPTA